MGTRGLGSHRAASLAPATLLVPVYDGWDEAIALLKTARSSKLVREAIVVIDNPEARVAELARFAGLATVLRHCENRGFGAAVNTGLTAVTTPVAVVCNSDLLIDANSLTILIEGAIRHGGVVGPATFTPTGNMLPTARVFPGPLRASMYAALPLQRLGSVGSWVRGERQLEAGSTVQGEIRCEWMVGSCLAFPMSIVERVGAFDEQFFMNCEEVDWQVRVAQHGFPRVCMLKAMATHAIGHGKTRDSGHAMVRAGWGFESLSKYAWKHFGPMRFVYWALAVGASGLSTGALWAYATTARRPEATDWLTRQLHVARTLLLWRASQSVTQHRRPAEPRGQGSTGTRIARSVAAGGARAAGMNAAEANRTFYRSYAEDYQRSEHCFVDPEGRLLLQGILDRALEHLDTRKPLALDACGGSGYVAELLSRRGIEAVVSDISPEMLRCWEERASRMGIRATIHLEEIASFLDKDDRQWDMIVFSSALHHLDDYKGVVRSACDALAPGGVMVTAFDPPRQHRLARAVRRLDYALALVLRDPNTFLRRLAGKLQRAGSQEDNIAAVAERHAMTGVSERAIIDAMRAAGLDVVEHGRYSYTRMSLSRLAFRILRTPNTFHLIAKKRPT